MGNNNVDRAIDVNKMHKAFEIIYELRKCKIEELNTKQDEMLEIYKLFNAMQQSLTWVPPVNDLIMIHELINGNLGYRLNFPILIDWFEDDDYTEYISVAKENLGYNENTEEWEHLFGILKKFYPEGYENDGTKFKMSPIAFDNISSSSSEYKTDKPYYITIYFPKPDELKVEDKELNGKNQIWFDVGKSWKRLLTHANHIIGTKLNKCVNPPDYKPKMIKLPWKRYCNTVGYNEFRVPYLEDRPWALPFIEGPGGRTIAPKINKKDKDIGIFIFGITIEPNGYEGFKVIDLKPLKDGFRL